jgi:hypothetical protein
LTRTEKKESRSIRVFRGEMNYCGSVPSTAERCKGRRKYRAEILRKRRSDGGASCSPITIPHQYDSTDEETETGRSGRSDSVSESSKSSTEPEKLLATRIRNRQAAMISRERRADMLSDLQNRIHLLEKENAVLRARVDNYEQGTVVANCDCFTSTSLRDNRLAGDDRNTKKRARDETRTVHRPFTRLLCFDGLLNENGNISLTDQIGDFCEEIMHAIRRPDGSDLLAISDAAWSLR